MVTADKLRSYTSKDLAQMAKSKGVPGWHSMRKDQLVRALVKLAKEKQKKSSANGKAANGKAANGKSTNGRSTPARKKKLSATRSRVAKTSVKKAASKSSANGRSTRKQPVAKPKSSYVLRRIRKANFNREQLKDLAASPQTKNGAPAKDVKDRIVLMVRDPYWLHAYWDVSRATIERVRASLNEHWHTARPVLRLFEVEDSTEQVVRDVEIHGGVNNWYIDVYDPPKRFRVAVGYLASNGHFNTIAKSNTVETPRVGSCDEIDQNWADVAQNYEKVFALSGGYSDNGDAGELRELFEERLRRPMGSPVVTKYGVGAEASLNRNRDFLFEVDAEMIVYGATKPDAHVTLAGEPVELRPDGTFTVRLGMPDKRQVLPVVASSCDGVEQHTVVLAVERNTKVMEPMIREPNQ